MRILQVSTIGFGDPRYYRSNELVLCRSLAKLGHEVTLFSSLRHPKWQMLDDRTVRNRTEVIDGFTLRRFVSGPELGTVPLMPSLYYEILKKEWDILHAHTILAPSSFYSALASRIKRKPLVVSQHDYVFGAVHGIKLFAHMFNNNSFGRFTMRTASAVIGLGSQAVAFAERFGADTGRTCVIPSSVDTTLFRPDQRSLLKEKWNIDGSVILFVGRLTKDKDPDTLLHAFRKVASKVSDAKLVIVGKGPDESRIRRLQSQMGLKQVFFLGRLPHEEMKYIYAGCKVLALPSLYEPFGNVLLEATSSGLPVVGTDVGGISDIIVHGENGYKIGPRDPTRLAEYLTQLLTNEETRSKMSRTARKKAVENYDDTVVAQAVEHLYMRCFSLYRLDSR